MDNKTDVKAMMARFNAGTSSPANAGPTPPVGRPKVPVHPTLSSGPPINAKKPVLEGSLSGSAASSTSVPKPNFLKSTVSTTSAPEMRESTSTSMPKPKPLVSRFEAAQAQEDTKPSFAKQFPPRPKPGDSPQESESSRSPFLRPAAQKPALGGGATTSTSSTPKPPPAVAKPSWIKDNQKSEESASPTASTGGTPPRLPQAQKPKSSLTQIRQQGDPSSGLQKPLGFRAAQHMFNREDNSNNKAEGEGVPSRDSPVGGSRPAPPHTFQKHLNKRPSNGPGGLGGLSDDPSAPKRNPLPNSHALGSPPAKPNRPPNVNLDKFVKGMAEPTAEAPAAPALGKKGAPPPPPAAHPSIQAAAVPGPTPPALPPCLPPRPPGAIISGPDENYDEPGSMNPPPLPPGGHPGQRHEDDGEEEYEDLDDKWAAQAEAKEQEKKQKDKKQKERQRKEADAKKKFKLTGPVQIIHKAKARVDCKGGKNELSLKQGEAIDIIRIGDNPEARWLARDEDGSFGYVKTDSVDIDFQSLKQIPGQMLDDQEVYDDIAPQNDIGGMNGQGVILPPPPGEDGEIYDDLDEPSFISVPPPPQFTPEGNSGSPIDEEIYDDVDSQGFPPPPPISSLPKFRPKGEEKDIKKQKKWEKEEKEFRKKFKFDGEILTLYQVTILASLSGKKWGGKDLPLNPGETLDVIVKPVDSKLVCRNSEGKFGYVSLSNIVVDDADIYDDIGDDCIYDND
ncbi:FYN-binding protein 1 isoform X2 [Engraulis encrasicolus]|uniref:FYN-binding protein 1 isoform X2 n=1 Tax=Engraulis encrasicolus TaxID=184585 RepID=UPI002FCEEF38